MSNGRLRSGHLASKGVLMPPCLMGRAHRCGACGVQQDAKPEDFARPHSYNFEQYDEFLKKFEAERDRRERLARGEAGDAPEE